VVAKLIQLFGMLDAGKFLEGGMKALPAYPSL
jgi:hypothetical protein